MNLPIAALALLLLAAVVLPFVLVGRSLSRRDPVTGKRRRVVPAIAILLLVEGIALTVIGFLGEVLEAGPELRGGDDATLRVLQGSIVAGILGTALGIALGIVAWVQRAARVRRGSL